MGQGWVRLGVGCAAGLPCPARVHIGVRAVLAVQLSYPLQSQGALQFVLPSEHGREVAGAGLVRASCWWQGACSTVRSCRRVVTLGAVFAWSCQPRGAALPVRAVAYRGGGGRW